jgi:hypothetical protein
MQNEFDRKRGATPITRKRGAYRITPMKWTIALAALLLAQYGWPSAEELPAEWSRLVPQLKDPNGCPNIVGRYSSTGTEVFYDRTQGASHQAQRRRTSNYVVEWHPRGVSVHTRHPDDSRPTIVGTAEVFEIRSRPNGFGVFQWLKGPRAEVTEFDQADGDYSCQDGWVRLAETSGGGSSEGGVKTIKVAVQLVRLTDGALLYRTETRSTRRDFLFFSNVREIVTFYYFPPYEN